MIQCPKCHIETRKVELEPGLTIDKCADCSGVWLDRGELAHIGGVPDGIFRWDQAVKSGTLTSCNCPACKNTKLEAVKYSFADSKIIIDLCDSCLGVWLDKNELGEFRKMLQKARIQVKKS